MKRDLAIVAAAIAALALAGAGFAAGGVPQSTLGARLSAQQEVPRPAGAGGALGSFTATLTTKKRVTTVKWTLKFQHLTGTVTRAVIHFGRRGAVGPEAIALCRRCKSPATGGIYGPHPRLLKALLNGGAYVNVYTKRNRAGEIRGQISRS